jgi:hypothetical protein
MISVSSHVMQKLTTNFGPLTKNDCRGRRD